MATGLALTIFGAGLSGLIGAPYVGGTIEGLNVLAIPFLSDLPVLGGLFFKLDPLAYFSILMLGLVGFFLNNTRAGLILRAVGNNHDSAHALGYSVLRVRCGAVIFGGVMAGFGRCLSAACSYPALVRGNDSWAWLDSACTCCFCILDAITHFDRCIVIWWYHNNAVSGTKRAAGKCHHNFYLCFRI